MEMKEEDDRGCYHEAQFTDQNGHLRTTRVPVVQDLALRGLKDLPKRFIKPYPIVPAHALDDASRAFPPIDVAKLIGSDAPESEGRDQELARLVAVAKEWGMFLIVNHGISSSVLDGVKDVVKGFFSLSFEEKKESVGSYANADNLGYGQNFVRSEEMPLNWLDRLAVKAAPKEASEGLRVWPQNPANFRQVMEKYVEEARRVCNNLLEALAEALSLERHAFLQKFEPKTSEINVRVNYYPPCPRPDLALGITPHTDGSALTFLMQFGASGSLQVFADTKWWTVPWPKDALLVGAGDLLEIMSNGRVKSPWHRAVTSRDVERFSVALFYNPPSQAEIGPVEDESISSEIGGYKKVLVGDYVQNHYKISQTYVKQAINFAKV